MYLRVLLALSATIITCTGQYRLPVISSHNRIAAGLTQTIPSGNIRHFLSYPQVSRAAYGEPLRVVRPSGPAYVTPPLNQLQKVGTLGLTTGLTGGIALGARAQSLGPVIAAIITHRTAEVVDVPVPTDVIEPQVLIVEPNLLPVTIEFRSQSSPVNVHQVHIPGPPGEHKQTRSEEEPDRVLHEVIKPVIQEVREVIQPFRKITQEILPVQEEVHSVVARGDNQKVIKEVAIPAPTPIQVAVVADAPAVTVEQPITPVLEEQVEPVLTATVVRAGLIGGARVFGARDLADTPLIGSDSSNSHRRVRVAKKLSINNRPAGRV